MRVSLTPGLWLEGAEQTLGAGSPQEKASALAVAAGGWKPAIAEALEFVRKVLVEAEVAQAVHERMNELRAETAASPA